MQHCRIRKVIKITPVMNVLFFLSIIVIIVKNSYQEPKEETGRIRQNFQNYFHSLVKDDATRNLGHCGNHSNEAAREKQVFEEFRTKNQTVLLAAEKYWNTEKRLFARSIDSEDAAAEFAKLETEKVAELNPEHATTMVNLPEMGQSFLDVRLKKKIFVDKTRFLLNFLDPPFYHKFSILTRPSGFGKTFFLDMLRLFFRGKKRLFKGTAIYRRGNVAANEPLYHSGCADWFVYPVIRLNFGELMKTVSTSFAARLENEIENIGAKYGVDGGALVSDLIDALWTKYQLGVVILIDEYDAPIEYALNVLKNATSAEEIRKVLRNFFHEIEAERDHIKLTIVVGVTQIHLGLYYDKHVVVHYDDLTHDKDFTSMLGFTHEDLDDFLQPHIENFANHTNRTLNDLMQELMRWYDGYRFAIYNETRVLNPVSMIQCLRKREFRNYWCSDNDSLAHIVDELIRSDLSADHFTNYECDWENLLYRGIPNVAVKSDKPRARSEIPLVVYMFVHGYLTIISFNRGERIVTLGYPNDEVKKTIASFLQRAKKVP